MNSALPGLPADQARLLVPDALVPWSSLYKLHHGRLPRVRPHASIDGVSLLDAAPDATTTLVFRDHPKMTQAVEALGFGLDGRRLDALPTPGSWIVRHGALFGDALGLRLVDAGGDDIETPRALFLAHLLRGQLPAELTTPAFALAAVDPGTFELRRPALPHHVAAPLKAVTGLALTCHALPRDVLVEAGKPLSHAVARATLDEKALDAVVFAVRTALHEFCQSLWWQVTDAERFGVRARAEGERLAKALEAVLATLPAQDRPPSP